MLDRLREFLEGFAMPADRARPGADDPRVAIAALLYHLCAADGGVTPDESDRIRDLIADKFAIGPGEASRIFEAGREADEEAVDLFTFTSVLMRHLDEDARVRFVRALWEVSLVDGQLGELEDNLIWRISDLLGISTRQRMEAKQYAAGRIKGDG